MNRSQWKMKSPVGPLYIVASPVGLHGVHWRRQAVPRMASFRGRDLIAQIISETVAQLEQYFDGQRTQFDLPLVANGTDFQAKVWNSLMQIPYGVTRSYSDIARSIENAKAVRAVGTANGRNAHSIIVPCHRVIAADGTLGGYAGGLAIKAKLLQLENPKF